MRDCQTGSLWTHFDGSVLQGPLAGTGVALDLQPLVHTTWGGVVGDPSGYVGARVGNALHQPISRRHPGWRQYRSCLPGVPTQRTMIGSSAANSFSEQAWAPTSGHTYLMTFLVS